MQYDEILKLARRLRSNQTASEKTLWAYLCKRKLDGRKFLRQHPIIYESKRNNHFFYIPDFYCREERLVIELDGIIHNKQKDNDHIRDLILESKGLRVLRIQIEELVNIEEVLLKIASKFK